MSRYKPPFPESAPIIPGLGRRYLEVYNEAVENAEEFYSKIALKALYWKKPWSKYTEIDEPIQKFFVGGYTNWTYNLDLQLQSEYKNKVVYFWEDEQGNTRTVGLEEYYILVNRIADALRRQGLEKGDRVVIYMPTTPEAAATVVAVNRLGGIFTPISPGLAFNALKQRIVDAKAKFIVTTEAAVRRGNIVPLKQIVDKALGDLEFVEKVIVSRRHGLENVEMKSGRDVWMEDILRETSEKTRVKPVWLEANEPITILYTSGTTGRPKGIVHSHVSAIVGVYSLLRWIMGFPDEGAHSDRMLNISELGWSTGIVAHVIGPQIFKYTAIIYDGAPNYPRMDQYLWLIEKYRPTIFWAVPTLFRMFRMLGDKAVEGHDYSSLRLIASIGEHFPADLWNWVYEKLAGRRMPVVNIYGSTESLAMASIPTRIELLPFKPGSPGVRMPGFELEAVDENGNPLKEGEIGALVIKAPFKAPYVFLTVWGDPDNFGKPGWKGNVQRFVESYYGIKGYYTTGDAGYFDEHGYLWIVGRIDDTLKISGHRITSAEIEDGINKHPAVAESMVVGKPDPIKGETAVAFIVLKPDVTPSKELAEEIRMNVREKVGPIAVLTEIYFVGKLPKNRSGKLVRRIGKSIVRKEPTGDITVLEDPGVIELLTEAIKTPF